MWFRIIRAAGTSGKVERQELRSILSINNKQLILLDRLAVIKEPNSLFMEEMGRSKVRIATAKILVRQSIRRKGKHKGSRRCESASLYALEVS